MMGLVFRLMTPRAAVALAVGALLLGSCGSAAGQPKILGRVRGTVLAGPTCPVEKPGDPSCAPVPVSGSVQFRQGDSTVQQVTIDPSGAFAIDVPAGTYTVTVDVGTGPFPTCPPNDIVVQPDMASTLAIVCDTGIR